MRMIKVLENKIYMERLKEQWSQPKEEKQQQSVWK